MFDNSPKIAACLGQSINQSINQSKTTFYDIKKDPYPFIGGHREFCPPARNAQWWLQVILRFADFESSGTNIQNFISLLFFLIFGLNLVLILLEYIARLTNELNS